MRSAFIALLYAAATLSDASAHITPAVNVSLRSSWAAPPFLVELLESFSLELPNSFFPLLNLLTDPNTAQKLKGANPKEIRDTTINLALQDGILKDSTDVAAVDSTLALHAATPAVQAFYGFYEDRYSEKGSVCTGKEGEGQAWVDWYGRVVCTAAELRELLNEQVSNETIHVRPQLLAFDHVHPAPSRVTSRPDRTAILYTSLDGYPWNLRELHEALYASSTPDGEGEAVEYVVRYAPPLQSMNGEEKARGSYLTGYGVALDLKKTDYLVLDDRHSRDSGDKEGAKDTKEDEELELDPLLEFIQSFQPKDQKPVDTNTPLTDEEIVELGYQASQLIISTASSASTNNNLTAPHSSSQLSLSPLAALTLLSQKFPKYTQPLSRRIALSPAVDSELRQNALRAQAGTNVVWVNGGVVHCPGGDVAGGGGPINGVDVLKMKRVLRREKTWVRALETLGMTREEAVRVISDSGAIIGEDDRPREKDSTSKTGTDASERTLEGRVDASDRPEGGGLILWWNDLEKDERYSRWSPSFYGLMRPMFPGQFPPVRRNLFNIILALDLSKPPSLYLLGGTVFNIIERGIPFRFGLLPHTASDEGRKMARAMYWLFKNAGRTRSMGWIKTISGMNGGYMNMGPPKELDWTKVKEEFDIVVREVTEEREEKDDLAGVTYESVVESGEEAMIPKEVQAYLERLDIKTLTPGSVGHAFFNGRYLEVGEDVQEFLGGLQNDIGYQMQYFQELVYQGTLNEEGNPDMSNWFYDRPGVSKRRNKYIQPSIGFGPSEGGGGRPLRVVSLPEVFENIGYEWKRIKRGFIYSPGNEALPFSVFLIVDLDSEDGSGLAKEALKFIQEENAKMRLAFIHNPSTVAKESRQTADASEIVARLIATGKMSDDRIAPQALEIALGSGNDNIGEPTTENDAQGPLGHSKQESLFSLSDKSASAYKDYVKMSKLLAREFGFAPGESGIVINGRVIGPIERGGFNAADFNALVEFEHKKRTEAALESIENSCSWVTLLGRVAYADIVSLTASVLGSMQLPDPSDVGMYDVAPKPRRRNYLALERNLTMFTHGDRSTAMYHIVFVINPLSETVQKWSSLIDWLTEMPDVYVEVHLNANKQTEIPLKRFYRYNVRSALEFDVNGNEIPARTTFESLPMQPLYTLAMDVPSSWLVRPREALVDLDNIQLTNLSPTDTSVDAVFELDYLVIEGHARETVMNSPPRGLQLQLVDSRNRPIADTLVVANLGSFQLRAKPGVFKLEIREGRGREVYQMDSAGNEGWDSPSVDAGGTAITLTSFDGLTLYPRFSRRKGMEAANVLEGSETEQKGTVGGIIDSFTSKFKSFLHGGKNANEVIEQKDHAEINIFTVASGLLYERFVGIMILSVLRNTNSTVKFWFIENFLSPSFLEFIPHMAEEYGFQYELVTYKWPSWLRSQREKQRIIWAYKILFLDVLFPMDLKKVIFVDADQIVRADLKELVDLDLHNAPYAYTPMGDDNHEMEGFRFWKKGYWAETLDGRPYHISALYVVDLVRFRQLAAGDILRGQYQQLSADPNSLANLDQDLPNNLQRAVPIHSLHEDWLWCETWCSKDRLHRAKTIDLCQNPLTKEPKLSRARQIPEWEEYDAEIAKFTRKLASEGKIKSGMAVADVNALAGPGNAPAISLTTESSDEALNTPSAHLSDEL